MLREVFPLKRSKKDIHGGFIFLCVALCSFPLLGQNEPSTIAEKHDKWLKEEVVYIITPKERAVFKKLETERERDMFIQEFWRHRDPTPGTPRNEFKEEHYRRIDYANERFGGTTPFDGWATDRGKFYIMLGDPAYIEKHLSSDVTHPIEIWYFQGKPNLRQAPFFRLMFFRRGGVGDYELYSPLIDGPKELVPSADLQLMKEVAATEGLADLDSEGRDPTTNVSQATDTNFDYVMDKRDRIASEILREQMLFEIAEAAWSSFPGRGDPSNALPSSVLIEEVESYPYKKIEDDYAVEFLETREIVEVTYSVNYINNNAEVTIIQDDSGIFFLNYAIEPDTLSVDNFNNKYLANLKISARVSDLWGKTIYQHSKDFPIELNTKQLEQIMERPFNLHDFFPLNPGNYKLDLLFENTVSKEFTSLEKSIYVPATTSILMMSPLLLSSKVMEDPTYTEQGKAFQVGELQIYPSLHKRFHQHGKMLIFFQAFGISPDVREKGQFEVKVLHEGNTVHTQTFAIKEQKNDKSFLLELSLDQLLPDSYQVEVSLTDGFMTLLPSKTKSFTVTEEPIPDPWVAAQSNAPIGDPIYAYILGNQLINEERIEEARDMMETAYTGKPDDLGYALGYARTLLINEEFARAKEILLPFAESHRESYALFYYLGKSSQEVKTLEEAISYFHRALTLRGNSTEVLNSLGVCYYEIGDKEQAILAWEKSLEVNTDQEKIQKLIEAVKNEIDNYLR
jgi:GWxTD domain-containing protein